MPRAVNWNVEFIPSSPAPEDPALVRNVVVRASGEIEFDAGDEGLEMIAWMEPAIDRPPPGLLQTGASSLDRFYLSLRFGPRDVELAETSTLSVSGQQSPVSVTTWAVVKNFELDEHGDFWRLGGFDISPDVWKLFVLVEAVRPRSEPAEFGPFESRIGPYFPDES